MSAHLGFKLSGLGYQLPKKALSDEDKRVLTVIFTESDAGSKGFLMKEDLKIAYLSLFGYKPSKYEVQQLLNDYGQENPDSAWREKCLTLPQFTDAMTPKLAVKDEDDEIRQTFMAFDTQCKGFLTLEDLKKVSAQIAPKLSENTIESAFRELDQNRDGRISYKDFDFMMKFGKDS